MRLIKGMAKLDTLFSRYIRYRDADPYGMCRCCTCGTRQHWKNMHAGHYITRDRWATRYDERNVHAQCSRCNLSRDKAKAYEQFMVRKYSGEVVEELRRLSKGLSGLNILSVQDLIDRYSMKFPQCLRRGSRF